MNNELLNKYFGQFTFVFLKKLLDRREETIFVLQDFQKSGFSAEKYVDETLKEVRDQIGKANEWCVATLRERRNK